MTDSDMDGDVLCDYCQHEQITYIPVTFGPYAQGSAFGSLLSAIQSVIENELIRSELQRASSEPACEGSSELSDKIVLQYAFSGLVRICGNCILIHVEANDYFPMHDGGMKMLHRALLPFRNSIALVCCHAHYNNSMINRLNINSMEEIVYISYKHNDRIEENVNSIIRGLRKNDIKYSIDKEHLGYRGNIRDYEMKIGRASRLIVFVIPEYLKSAHCMVELSETFRNGNIEKRIYPLVDTGEFDRTSRGAIQLRDYWANRRSALLQMMQDRNDTNEQLMQELQDINSFLDCINDFWKYICEVNTMDIDTLTRNDAEILIEAIKKDINKQSSLSGVAEIEPTLAPVDILTSGSNAPVQPTVNQFGNNAVNIINNNGTINFHRS